jgi:putative methyltransferase (TIGR04325 family)
MIKRKLKYFIPPVLLELFNLVLPSKSVNFKGVYANWEAVSKLASGYESESILQQAIINTQKVISNEVSYERDGVVFNDNSYPFPLISALLRSATESKNRLCVLDFGGSLGSTYYQCRSFLNGLDSLKWCVVEQSHFVKAGNTYFANDVLHFYRSISEVLKQHKPNLILFSGVLQYLPAPFATLQEAIKSGAEYIVIDRNPFIARGKRLLSLQKVPKKIVASSYPVWLFNEDELKEYFLGKYIEITTFEALDGVIGNGRLKSVFKGMVFKRINLESGS